MSKPVAQTEQFASERYIAVRNITLLGVLANVLLSVGKILFGIIGHSQALVADGIHSLSDLLSDGVVLIAARYGNQAADTEHPYGHGRFETLATVAVGLLLMLVAAGLLVDAIIQLLMPTLLLQYQPTLMSLMAALASILIKEMLYQYTMRVARRLNSAMLKANAWHHRSDAISSVVVLIGLLGAMAGMTALDVIAAIIVSIMIGWIGGSLIWQSLQELVDTAVDEEKRENIEEIIKAVDGVQNFHALRTRSMGSQILIDVHIIVNPYLSVSEGHQISEHVKHRLKTQLDDVYDVLIHIDPENDKTNPPNLDLPERHLVLQHLKQHWQVLDINYELSDTDITLHYLGRQLRVEIRLPLKAFNNLSQAQHAVSRFEQRITDTQPIHHTHVHYSVYPMIFLVQ